MTVRRQRPVRPGRAGPRRSAPPSPLMVTPAHRRRCPHVPLGGAWTGSGDNRPRAFASGSAEDVTVREYRRGDDLRRVHWRSSAARRRADGAPRGAAVAVARDAVPRQPAARPPRAGPRRRSRPRSSAAASIAVHLGQRGFAVRLVTAAGEDPAAPGTSTATPTPTPARCWRRWPCVQPIQRPDSTPAGWPSRRTAACWSPCSASLEPTDVPVLRRMQHHAAPAPGDRARRRRLGAGSRGAERRRRRPRWLGAGRAGAPSPLGPRDRLDPVWQELGRSPPRLPHAAAPAAPAGTRRWRR